MNHQTLQRPEKVKEEVDLSDRLSLVHSLHHTHTLTHFLSLSSSLAPRLKVVGPRHSPVGVLLRNEEEGVMGGVTGGVRLPLLWRGGVDTFPRDTELDKVSDSFG